MHTIEDMLVEKNYSKCPLKKRPVNYQFDYDVVKTPAKDFKAPNEQPENLSLKKETSENTILENSKNYSCGTENINIINDCCEDEGVDVDHRTDDEDEEIDCEDDEDEMIDCVDIDEEDGQKTTQAAALAAAAAAASAASASALIVPTPTYPKYGLQTWNFHMSPYTAEFYRTINNPHLASATATSLCSDLLSPSSPSDSVGSLSPPPSHYIHGRSSSISPPMRSEIIHRPIGVRHLPQSPSAQNPHRFMPYQTLPTYPQHIHAHPHHHQHTSSSTAYSLSYHAALPTHHHAPISPAYSDSSYYSMRSLTPESNCSSLPEDLSLKHSSSLSSKTTPCKSSSNCTDDAPTYPSDSSTNLTTNISTVSSSPLTAAASSSHKKDKNAPPRYQCPDCQKSYSTFSGLTKHQQFHCPAAEGNQVKKSFSCKDCEKTYVSLGALKMHIRTHTLPCKCNICGKAFSRPWLLQGHIRTHTGEKPFSCQHCHRAFADRSNLRAHLQTHSDIKKYSCSSCSKTFSRMSLLTKHSEGGCPGGSGNGSNSILASSLHEMSSYPMYAEH